MLLNKADVIADVQRALAEDVGTGDVTAALLPDDLFVEAIILSRESMVVCGQLWVECVFAEMDPTIEVEWLVDEGTWLEKPTTLCHIRGLARHLLTAERTALNFLQTLSATATQTYRYVQALQGYSTRLLDTRKTLPGLRLAQKYAVHCAGGSNHRLGLYDGFLIKENHIRACGSITAAVRMAKQSNKDLPIEVEVETLDELQEALATHPSRILLDNFTLEMMLEAVAINRPWQCDLEASGGIGLDNIKSIAKTGIEYISVGAITKSIQAIDLSLLIRDTK